MKTCGITVGNKRTKDRKPICQNLSEFFFVSSFPLGK